MFSFNRTRTSHIGLHLGQQSATLVQLSGGEGHRQVHAIAKSAVPYLESASSEEQDREVASALRKLIADHHFRGRTVVSCLGSQQLFVQNVRLPKLPPEEVEKVVRWEAEERLPYPVTDAEIRYLTAGEVRQDANVKQEVILMACHQGVIQRHIALLELAGLVPVAFDVEPCALLRSLVHAPASADDGAPTGGAAGTRRGYLHLGERSTAVIIAEGTQVLFLKYIASGGYHFDMAVARHLQLPAGEAARMRALVTASRTLDSQDELHRSIADAIRGPLESMCAEIELCLRYYKVTFRGQPLERTVVAGDEASPWLAEYLTERLAMPCELANPFATISQLPAQPQIEQPARWAAALGLSLKDVA